MGCCQPKSGQGKKQAKVKLRDQNDSRKKEPEPDLSQSIQEENVLSADELKQLGNQEFSKQNYNEALEFYQQALIKAPQNPIIHQNIAITFFKLQQVSQALESAQNTNRIDPTNIKAYVVSARSYAYLAIQNSSIPYIEASLEQYAHAKYQTKIQNKLPFVQQIKNLRNKIRIIQSQLKQKETQDNISQVLQYYQQSLDSDSYRILEELIQEQPKQKYESIHCPISLVIYKQNIYNKPVVNSIGNTYERSMIELHYQQSDATDPISRKFVNKRLLIPNKSITRCTNWLCKHTPWVFNQVTYEALMDLSEGFQFFRHKYVEKGNFGDDCLYNSTFDILLQSTK